MAARAYLLRGRTGIRRDAAGRAGEARPTAIGVGTVAARSGRGSDEASFVFSVRDAAASRCCSTRAFVTLQIEIQPLSMRYNITTNRRLRQQRWRRRVRDGQAVLSVGTGGYLQVFGDARRDRPRSYIFIKWRRTFARKKLWS